MRKTEIYKTHFNHLLKICINSGIDYNNSISLVNKTFNKYFRKIHLFNGFHSQIKRLKKILNKFINKYINCFNNPCDNEIFIPLEYEKIIAPKFKRSLRIKTCKIMLCCIFMFYLILTSSVNIYYNYYSDNKHYYISEYLSSIKILYRSSAQLRGDPMQERLMTFDYKNAYTEYYAEIKHGTLSAVYPKKENKYFCNSYLGMFYQSFSELDTYSEFNLPLPNDYQDTKVVIKVKQRGITVGYIVMDFDYTGLDDLYDYNSSFSCIANVKEYILYPDIFWLLHRKDD